MQSVASLKRSSPSLSQIALLRGIHSRQLSSSSSSVVDFVKSDPNSDKNPPLGSFLGWVSGIAVGSSLGLLYWSSTAGDNSQNGWSFSFADSCSTSEPAVHARRSKSLFPKLSLPAASPNFFFGDAYRRKVFFNYEKRIRLRSPPEKVFEYFASVRTPEGELLMKPADLMRAVVPVFPPSESNLVRDGYLRGERSPGELRCVPSEFFMLFDMNNDGLISFKEYIFFVTLLSIPELSFLVAFKMFDIDNDGEIDKEEFKKVMGLMRAHNRQGAHHKGGLRAGSKVSGTVENGGLVEYFFGKDGKQRVHHDKFVRFMRKLHDEMLKLEFAHYDYKSQGTISAKDFALSMVASADMGHIGMLLDRVDKINDKTHLGDVRITFEEFNSFAELRKKLQPLSLALFAYGKINGLLTREDFQRAAFQVCGTLLTDNVVKVIFHVFDSNNDGNLSSEEFVRVLYRRERDIAQPVESGLSGLFSCYWNCTNSCSTEGSFSKSVLGA